MFLAVLALSASYDFTFGFVQSGVRDFKSRPISSLSPSWSQRKEWHPHLRQTTLHAEKKATDGPRIWEKLVATFSTSVAEKISKKYNKDIAPITQAMGALTLIRVFVPSLLAGIGSFLAFPGLSLWLCSLWNDAGVFAVLSQDSSQFVQNFLTFCVTSIFLNYRNTVSRKTTSCARLPTRVSVQLIVNP